MSQTKRLTLHTDRIKTSAKHVVFNAPLVDQVATLQTGDSIIDTGTNGILNATFDPVATNILGAAIHGVSTWNLTNLGTFNFGEGNTQIITGGTLVTGLKTLNDLNSNAPIVVGVSGAPLQTALTTVGLSNEDSSLSVLFAAAALSAGTDTLAVNLDNVAGSLTIGPDGNATTGYETWNIKATGNNTLYLSQGSATSGTVINISGSGSVDLTGSGFPDLTTINASASTGNVVISSSVITGGLLTFVKGGSGDNTFDSSNADYTPAVINAMTTLDGGSGTVETLILNDAALTTTVPLTTVHDFQVIEGSGSGTINMAFLPSSVTDLTLNGTFTINNAPDLFTVNLSGGSYAINAANVSALTNELTFLNPDMGGAVATTGFGTVEITSSQATSYIGEFHPIIGFAGNSYYTVTFTANSGASETVNITGTQPLFAGILNLSGNANSTTINDTDTSSVTLFGASAAVIDASSSGGLVMVGPDTNVSGMTGDTITGSMTAANTLIGSLGNDMITASLVGGDTIITGGGADNINMNAHTVGDTIQFSGYQLQQKLGGTQYYTSGETITGANDLNQPAFWGVPPSGSGGGVVPSASTSVDQSVITNFHAGSGAAADGLQFAVAAWGLGTTSYGLIGGGGNSSGFFNSSLTYDGYSGPATIDAVAPNTTLSTTANVIELTGATFANASQLATALGSTYNLTFGGGGSIAANTDAHMLFLYNDASGNAHIADVDFENGSTAATTTSAVPTIVASDMVELTGVSATSLTANNIHFV